MELSEKEMIYTGCKKMKKSVKGIITIIALIVLISSSIQITAYSNNLNHETNDETTVGIKNIPKDAEWYDKPNSYNDLVTWYQDLESEYPEYIEIFKANEMYGTEQATGGYDQYYVRITNESCGFHKPEVLFLGSPHGDETAGTIGMYWFADWLMRMAYTDEVCPDYSKEWLRWLIDHREIYLEISHNPYGFDQIQRYDANGWDLNREADHDGPGSPTGGIWASENGKTLRRFIDNHTIRVGCDFHGGTRALIYPWAGTNGNIYGTSPVSGYTNEGAPPDFYFYDASSLRLGSYIGDCCGDGIFDEYNVQTIAEYIWYSVHGGIAPWAYAADVVSNPAEDPYVEDETYGNYPGAGILWLSPEMSYTKNVPEYEMGNDTTDGWGTEIRRFILHQTDLAQPYVRWQMGTIEDDEVAVDESIPFNWQVNGSMVVEHTSIQWGSDPDPINNYEFETIDNNEYDGEYIGGTGWDNAEDGNTDGVVYSEDIIISDPGEYYFVAKAQVDQIYENVLSPETYGNNPYLRLIKERTNDSYYESLDGSDGEEEIIGQTWWYSPIIHVTVGSQIDAMYMWEDIDGAGPNTEISFDASMSTGENISLYEWDWNNDGIYDYSDVNPFASYDYGDTNPHICTLCITDDSNQTDIYSDVIQANVIVDVEQTVSDRPFLVRHASDGDWGGAQNFTPTLETLTKVELYMKKLGTPDFDLTVELREDSIDGTLLDTITMNPGDFSSDWEWIELDFDDISVTPDTEYFVVLNPPPTGLTTTFGYGWGYALGDMYDDGSLWFTRTSGSFWLDLPSMYDYTFRTYGYL